MDVHVPGNGGFDIQVARSYNSSNADLNSPGGFSSLQGTLAGVGWTVHFGRVLKKTTNSANLCSNLNALTVADNPTLELPDGSRQMLAFTGNSSPLALTPQRWRADCAAGGQGMTVYSPTGVRYDMTQAVYVGTGTSSVWAWYTKRITDRNGNYADITYENNSSPQISSVATNDGRVISFSYHDSGRDTRRIASISAHGATYSYNYQAVAGVMGAYQLTSVTRPDGSAWQYAYNGKLNAPGSYLMNRVTHPEGGYLSYGYGVASFDAQSNPTWGTTVVSTKTASTGGNWSFAYAPGASGRYDRTTVTTPAGTIVYQHVGPNFVSSGNVWMVGLMVSKQEGSERTETLSWGKQKISNENYFRPGQFLLKVDAGETNAPVLQQRTVTQNGATHTTTFLSFDGYGNPANITEAGPNGGNRSTSLSYYINPGQWIINQVQNETVSGGVAIQRAFDGNGNLVSLVKDGVTTRYTWDGQGNMSSATFPRSLTHSYSNYKRGIAQTESQPEGITT